MVLQAVGAIIASVALSENKSLQTADDFIITGLASQVFNLFVFNALCVDFGFRVRRRRHRLGDNVALVQDPHLVHVRNSWKFHGFLFALGLFVILVFWRFIYRVVELNQGFFGPVTFKHYLFVGFEGVLMLSLVSALGIFYPATCLGEARHERTETDESAKGGDANKADGLMDGKQTATIRSGDRAEHEIKIDDESRPGKPEHSDIDDQGTANVPPV